LIEEQAEKRQDGFYNEVGFNRISRLLAAATTQSGNKTGEEP